MTAMCDVAFLLLTFFMLTTKFKTENPVVVADLPKANDTTLLPANTIQISIAMDSVSSSCQIFYSIDGQKRRESLAELLFERNDISVMYLAKFDEDSKSILLDSNFRSTTKKKVQLNVIREFSLEPNVDVALRYLPIWLQLSQEERAKIKDASEKNSWKTKLVFPGNKTETLRFGLDTTARDTVNKNKCSDLQVLTFNARNLDLEKAYKSALASGQTGEKFDHIVDSLNSRIAIRGEQKIPYPLIKYVINALQDVKEFKYFFITNIRKTKKVDPSKIDWNTTKLEDIHG